jgi:CheY-like chemotaxis protein
VGEPQPPQSSRVAALLEKTACQSDGRAAADQTENSSAGEWSSQKESACAVNEVGDDRDNIKPGDRVLLIVENEQGFARFMMETARENGFKVLVTSLGAAALTLTREYKPDAISLDIHLPDIDGWRVLERIKNDITTRHVPVCVISTDESREKALASGALAFVAKPLRSSDVLEALLVTLMDFISRSMKCLLVVEPDSARRAHILETIAAEDLQVAVAHDGRTALQTLGASRIDCVVLNPGAFELIDEVREHVPLDGELNRLPLIIYGEGEPLFEREWKRLAGAYTVRRAYTPERLLDLSAFFLHRNIAKLPEAKRVLLLGLHQADKILGGKRVLIVDDDMRNIFALSAVLEEYEMQVISADNGRDAIRILKEEAEVDIVLMDIMMPEMDGMETIRELRKIAKLKNVPIVAVTAKAMKGDREKCIEAGAWDYLSKPVDSEQMLGVLRAWLHR